MHSLGDVQGSRRTQGSCVVHPGEIHLAMRVALRVWWARSTMAFAAWVVCGGVMKGCVEELHERGPELLCEGHAMMGGNVFRHNKATDPSRQES